MHDPNIEERIVWSAPNNVGIQIDVIDVEFQFGLDHQYYIKVDGQVRQPWFNNKPQALRAAQSWLQLEPGEPDHVRIHP